MIVKTNNIHIEKNKEPNKASLRFLLGSLFLKIHKKVINCR